MKKDVKNYYKEVAHRLLSTFKIDVRKFKLNNIRFKLILAFSLPIIFIISLGTLSYQMSSKSIIKNYEDATMGTIQMVSNYYDLGMEGAQSKVVQYINNNNMNRYYSGRLKKDLKEELQIYNDLKKDVTTNVAADRFIYSMQMFANYGDDITTINVGSSNLYDDYIKSSEFSLWNNSKSSFLWTGYHDFVDDKLSVDKNKYAISLIYRMQNKSGYVIADIKLDCIKNELKDIGVGRNGVVGFVTNDDREILINSEKENYFKNLNFYKKIKLSKDKSGSSYETIGNSEYLFMYSKVGNTGSIVCATIPKEEIISKVKNIKNITVLFVTISSLIALILASIISGGIGKTIKYITNAMEKVAAGELNISLSTSRKDEFKILINSIDKMISDIRLLISDEVLISSYVSQSVTDISKSTNNIVDSNNNITEAINEIEKGVIIQAEDSTNCLLQMSSLSVKITTVCENTNKIEKIAGNTRLKSKDGIEIVNDLCQKSKETAMITNTIIQEVMDLKQQSNEIYSIINIIKEIAEQSDLLSLNAAIEAARAGSAGSGFSVVAVEIGKLSQQSLLATEKIRSIINMIQYKIADTVDTAISGEKIVAEQVLSLENTVTIFDDIHISINELVENLSKINDDMSSIEEAKDLTLNDMENITAVSEETSAATEAISVSLQTQALTVEKLQISTLELSKNEDNLKSTIMKFSI